jgi:glycosyltransferase involved in cell wall biosynthesis
MGNEIVWWPDTSSANGSRVAVVTVSYNTKELTALLLWSLRTLLDWPALEIVVVDNGSTDGSDQLLAQAQDAGICTYLPNEINRTHGPGLNQGISWLASRREPLPTWIWVLDSDVVVARPDALTASLALAERESVALLGESWWDQWHKVERFETYSLLFKPAEVWRQGAEPFAEGGDPSFELLNSATKRGVHFAEFPFVADSYIIHRGRGSLAAVAASGEVSNPHYEWALTRHEPHFGLVPGAQERYEELLRTFRQVVGEISGSTLTFACERSR